MKAHERAEWLIAYALAFVSAATASLYGFMSAAGPYGLVKGAGLFCVAFIGCHGPAWIVKAKQRLGWPGALFGILVTGVCLAATLWGGLGTNASGGAALRAERTKASSTVADDRAELARLLSERAGIPDFTTATAETVTAAADAVSAAERTRKAECGNGDPKQRGKNCRLRETEEAAARTALTTAVANKATTDRAAKLDSEAAAIRARLDKAAPPIEADPQASAFSRLTGVPVATSAALNAFWLSLAFELGAMFAMMLAYSNIVPSPATDARPGKGRVDLAGVQSDVSPETQVAPEQQAAPAADEPAVQTLAEPAVQPAPISSADTATVGRFMLACLPRAQGERASWGAIYARYKDWCAEQDPPLAPLQLPAFGVQFGEICKRVGIPTRSTRKAAYCLDVRLSA